MKKKTAPVPTEPPAPATNGHDAPEEARSPTTTPEETQARVVSARALQKGRKAVAKHATKLEKLKVVDVPFDDLTPNDWNPNRQSDHDFELLLRSMEEDGFCVSPRTPVLCADLTWHEAGELREGDQLIAFDEQPVPQANRKHGRRFRTATVTYNDLRHVDLYEVYTSKGFIRCNAEHPWLVRRGHHAQTWVTTTDLTPGDQVVYILAPWVSEPSWEAGWLAGMLDGEGHLSRESSQHSGGMPITRLGLTQRPGLVADRMFQATRSRADAATLLTQERRVDNPLWNDMSVVRVSRLSQIMSLLGRVRPVRLVEQARAGLWEGRSIAQTASLAEVISVSAAGRGEIASLSTSTGTYIAGGFAMHNTQPIVALREKVGHHHIIIDGEHRWRAAGVLHLPVVPTVFVDMSVEQAKIATIRHNRARGSHEIELEAAILRDLQQLGALDWAQDSLMLDDTELERMLKDISAPEALADKDYSDAWVPDDFSAEEAELIRHGTKDTSAQEEEINEGGGTVMRGMTREAIEASRRREDLIARAKTAQDARTARQQAYMYRVSLVFSGEEGQVVKAALGDHPAEALMEMCRAKMQAPR